MKRSNNYIYSSYYQEHFQPYWIGGKNTWRFGTKSYCRSIHDRIRFAKKMEKSYRAERRNERRNLRRQTLMSISIESTEEEIDEALIVIANSEQTPISWWYFD